LFLGRSFCRDRPHRALHLDRDELELTRGQSKPSAVAHGATPVDEHDETVLAVEHLIDQLVDALCFFFFAESLPKRHGLRLPPSMNAGAGDARPPPVQEQVANRRKCQKIRAFWRRGPFHSGAGVSM
jgi:hypothetical protein